MGWFKYYDKKGKERNVLFEEGVEISKIKQIFSQIKDTISNIFSTK